MTTRSPQVTGLAITDNTSGGTTSKYVESQSLDLLKVVLIGLALFIGIVVLVVLVIFIVYRFRRRRRLTRTSTKKKDVPENIPLKTPTEAEDNFEEDGLTKDKAASEKPKWKSEGHETKEEDAAKKVQLKTPIKDDTVDRDGAQKGVDICQNVEEGEQKRASNSSPKPTTTERMPKRKKFNKKDIRRFRQSLNSGVNISDDCLKWLAWNLADFVIKHDPNSGADELYKGLNFSEDRLASLPGEYGTTEHIVSVLQDWWRKRDKATAWNDLQQIIRTKLTYLKKWLHETKERTEENV